MSKLASILIGAVASVMILSAISQATDITIICPGKGTLHEQLAAKEIRRYLYLRTGQLLPIVEGKKKLPAKGDLIILGQKDWNIISDLAATDKKIKSSLEALQAQQYQIKTLELNSRKIVLIAGGDSIGTLYGTYRFIESFGVRFYLHSDTIPDAKVPMLLPQLDDSGKPLFHLRGIVPFHDFPEGPDWWNIDDYKAVLSQIPKLRMNFIGLHTYPYSDVGPEPLVWIGVKDDLATNGTPKFSYPARHFTTINGTGPWGSVSMDTNDYKFGSMMYDRNDYGADYMKDMAPWPNSPAKCNELFIRVSKFFKEAFLFAHKLDIKTCVGTETPLTIPDSVKQHLLASGKDPNNPQTVEEVYQGMFTWVTKNYPLDYYWLWTPESWTWKDAQDSQVQKTQDDLLTAVAAAKKADVTFTLATSGWVLGPTKNMAQFDNVLPKNMPFSCLNRKTGFTPVEQGFKNIKDREKWAIPWIEDDPALTIPQLWAGRMRRDAADALAYGCTGLMGNHWRTRIIAPNISALAQAGWQQDPWNKNLQPISEIPDVNKVIDRGTPVQDFYADWAETEFGPQAAQPLAKLFASLDTGQWGSDKTKGVRRFNLPRPAAWVNGPGAVNPNPNLKPWKIVSKDYKFVDEMAKLRPQIKGAGNLERFDYWLNNFQYLKAFGQLACNWNQYQKVMAKVTAEKDTQIQKQLVLKNALPIRRQMLENIAQAQQYLMMTVSTNGELGTVENWQQHIIPQVLDVPGKQLSKILDRPLPLDAQAPKQYQYEGPTRIIVPTVRTNLLAGEYLELKVIILSQTQPLHADLYWRYMAGDKYEKIALTHVTRGVYSGLIPAARIKKMDFEYHIKVETKDQELYYPVTAPHMDQTVVVTD